MKKAILFALLGGSLLTASPQSALATNGEHGSCLGVTASSVPPGTKDDIAQFITLVARASGTTHGALVSSFAHEKGACVEIQSVPPHP